MKKTSLAAIVLSLIMKTVAAQNVEAQQVETVNGRVQGITESSGVCSFKGIPYAQPPVGNLRWREPQPAKSWKGVLKADHFGPAAMQRAIWSDMILRSMGTSEDCLYLNIWTPAKSSAEKLPVLVYFYGGGFIAGDGSEGRYDGESMAQKGIVVVTLNYRLGVFGFLSHPELTRESEHHASGNYGLMDQHAALVWVHRNIAAFGGDPQKVTIGGESAGSASVSAQMASPLSKALFRGAIAESGSLLGHHSVVLLKDAEKQGQKFADSIGRATVADLRAIPANKLLEISAGVSFPVSVDGYFLPETPLATFTAGRQMDVPLLSGWNSAEVDYRSLLDKAAPTLANYKAAVERLYGRRADEVLNGYPAQTDAEVPQVATDLASDRFIAYATWKFIDLHGKTNGYPVYRYLFLHQRPPTVEGSGPQVPALGAPHASEIDYALGNLRLNKFYHWTAQDKQVSVIMQTYLANFIKTGDPNGEGLARWYGLQSSIPKVMYLNVKSESKPEMNLKRYMLLDSLINP